ncbi:hypothetical protein HJO_06060 [Hyphomonas johnsonii MHS-2]|uniref:Uncharacterized protein n=1 Tax=Hyphomonas johnsonii MHS-2 TaxID=1280950 RepID=A0A059FS08_9PROT|nr:hypothetical protein HJO_06060 [Hyphomonas johnsonii MHS-2]
MKWHAGVAVGLGLVLIGALKTWAHVEAARTLTLPGCLGSEFVIRLGAPTAMQVHCWGCYAVLMGLVLIAGSFAWSRWERQIMRPALSVRSGA